VLSITARDYEDAARALGAPAWRIAWSHVLPNATAPIVVQASLSVAFAILAEASLSFLGLGIQPPAASWGSMINAGRGYLQQAPWIVFGPGAALFVTVVGLNFVGDAVREALDPRIRETRRGRGEPS
jgi:peptide/nickel transport system permease protein